MTSQTKKFSERLAELQARQLYITVRALHHSADDDARLLGLGRAIWATLIQSPEPLPQQPTEAVRTLLARIDAHSSNAFVNDVMIADEAYKDWPTRSLQVLLPHSLGHLLARRALASDGGFRSIDHIRDYVQRPATLRAAVYHLWQVFADGHKELDKELGLEPISDA